MELVVDDPGVGQVLAQALPEGLPHVDADGPDNRRRRRGNASAK
ncbi:MAG TPA: hypothetical protein VHQ69_10215 [Methylomirabilota bacterium]|nr:hypothetical protein [Methylomirabilota bacterium]